MGKSFPKKDQLIEFAVKTLEDEKVPIHFKPSLAFFLITMPLKTEGKKMLRDMFLAEDVYLQFPKVVLNSERPTLEWFDAMSKNLIQKTGKNDFKAAFATLDFLEKGTRPTVSSTLSEADSSSMAWKVKPVETKTILTMFSNTPVLQDLVYLAHQHLKFGPVEQILLRKILLGLGSTDNISAMLNQRDLIVEKLLQNQERAPPLTKISKP